MEKEVASYDGLPSECVSLILSKCCPRDVGRFSTISRTWAEAAASEEVWVGWVPIKDVFGGHFADVQRSHGGREVFHALRRGAFSNSKEAACKEYLVTADPNSGSISLHVSAFRCLYFAFRNDNRHKLDDLWITPHSLYPTSTAGSTFENSAAVADGVYHIHGELCPDFSLPAGTYSISFKIAKPAPLLPKALFPAACMISAMGDPLPLINVKVDLHKDGKPARKAFEMNHKQEASGGDGEEMKEPEFWAKSQDPESKPALDLPWEAINKQILHAASFFMTEWTGGRGEKVKPWTLQKQPLTWEEFFVGEVVLADEGGGRASVALDLVFTDLECQSFRGAIWVDSVVMTKVADV